MPEHTPQTPSVPPRRRLDAARRTEVDRRQGHYCCFPDVCRTATGRLLAVYAETDRHLHAARRALLLRTSDDAGRTWSAPQLLHAHGGHCPRITALPGGHVVVIDDNPRVLYWSLDDGRTWARCPAAGFEHSLPDRVLRIDTNTFFCTGHLARGRAPRPALGQPPTEQMGYLSEDRCRSWKPLSPLAVTPHLTLCEGSVFRARWRDEDALVALLRENTHIGEPLYATVSTDSGRTWSDPVATPLVGHRPTAGLTASGRVLVTYRDVGPDMGTAAWLGDLDELLDPPGGDGFRVHGLVSDTAEAAIRDGFLEVTTHDVPGGKKEDGADPAPGSADEASRTMFLLRPLSDPATARLLVEVDVCVDQGGPRTAGVRVGGGWWHIGPDGVRPDRDTFPRARAVPLARGEVHRLQFVYEGRGAEGEAALYVDGRKRRSYVVPADASARLVCVGTPRVAKKALRKETAGVCRWASMRQSVSEPRLLRTYDWFWTPDQGMPDAWVRDRVLELHNDRAAWIGDFGYSGWTALPGAGPDDPNAQDAADTFLCLYHHGGAGETGYTKTRTARIMAARFSEKDFFD